MSKKTLGIIVRPHDGPIVIPNTPAGHRVIDIAVKICNKYRASQKKAA